MNRNNKHRRKSASISRRPGVSAASVAGRAWADRWPLVLTTLVVALAAFLSCATPRLVAATGDDALRYAVREAGPRADITITRSHSENPYVPRHIHVDLALDTRGMTESIQGTLVPELDRVLAVPVTTFAMTPLLVLGPENDLVQPVLRTAFVDRDGPPAVTWVHGGAARETLTNKDLETWVYGTPIPVEVGLSEAVAQALGVEVGDTIPVRNANQSVFVDAKVSGVFRADDPTDPVWSNVPGILEPRVVGSVLTRQTQLAGLLSDDSLPIAVFAAPPGTTTRSVTFAPDPDTLGQDDVGAVTAEIAGLRVSAAVPVSSYGGSRTSVTTGLDTVLLDARARFGAATAQASVLLAGVLSVALLTLLVAATLLVRRRASVIATHRARGATLPGIAVELGAESILVAAAGCGLGVYLAGVVVPGAIPLPWLIPVAIVAALGAPTLAVRRAARSAGGRKVAANRTERSVADKDRHAGRIAAEAAAVLLAAGALAALRTRGVTGAATSGADPLLALAPTLGALAGAILLLRALPPLLRWGVAGTTRARRAVPVLAAARAHATAGAVLPFLALTVAASLVVFGATFVTTVRQGEIDASWLAVGADATVTSDPDPALVGIAASLRTRDGVQTVLTGRVEDHVEVFGPWGGNLMRLVVLPSADFADLLASTPLPDAPELAQLGVTDSAGRPAVLLSAGLRTEGDTDLVLAWDRTRVDITTVGTASAVLTAGEDTVVVDGALLEPARGVAIEPNRLWVVGPGAEAAVATTPELDVATVSTRSEWLAAHRTEPLTVSVQLLAVASTVVLLLLAVLVVVLAAATSAPHRGVTLGTLRTLGLSGRAARTVTAGELLPGTLLASAGGTALGVLLAVAATGPLALRLVTGQPTDPRTALTAWAAAPPVVVGLAVLVLVLVESSLRRRERLGEILRVGGTP